MVWDVIANIASLLAAVGVIASIVYLAQEVRQSALATQASATDAWLADYNAMVLEITRSEELASIFRRGLTDFEALDGNDKMRFHVWMVAHMLNAQTSFLQLKEGSINEQVAVQTNEFNAALIKTPGGRQWWDYIKPIWRESFVTHIEALSENSQAISELWPWFSTKGDPVA